MLDALRETRRLYQPALIVRDRLRVFREHFAPGMCDLSREEPIQRLLNFEITVFACELTQLRRIAVEHSRVDHLVHVLLIAGHHQPDTLIGVLEAPRGERALFIAHEHEDDPLETSAVIVQFVRPHLVCVVARGKNHDKAVGFARHILNVVHMLKLIPVNRRPDVATEDVFNHLHVPVAAIGRFFFVRLPRYVCFH